MKVKEANNGKLTSGLAAVSRSVIINCCEMKWKGPGTVLRCKAVFKPEEN